MTAKRKSNQEPDSQESTPPTIMEPDSDSRSLYSLAENALRGMILDGKISAGDLIKVLGLDNPAAEQASMMADFVVQLKDE